MASKTFIKSITTQAKMCNKIVQPRKMEIASKGSTSFVLSDSPIDYNSLDMFRQETDRFLKRRELRRQEISYIDSLVREAWSVANRENARLSELKRQERIQDKMEKQEKDEDAEIEKLKLELEAEEIKQAQPPPPPPIRPHHPTPALDEVVKKPRSVRVYPQPPSQRKAEADEPMEPHRLKIGYSDPYYCTSSGYQYCCRPHGYLRDEANLDPMSISNLQDYDDRSHFFEYRPQWIWKRPSNLQMQISLYKRIMAPYRH